MEGSDINKMDIKSLFELAMQSFKAGDINNANKIFRHITEMQVNYDNVDELYYKGMSHFYSQWERTKAIRCFKKILKIGTTDTQILFDIGKCFYVQGYILQAVDCFDEVLDLSNDINKLYNFELNLKKFGDRSMIYEYFDKILNLPDKSIEEKYYKAISAFCLYRDPLAIDYFKEVAEKENQNIRILMDTANKLTILKDYDAAYKCLQKTLNSSGNNITILCGATKLSYSLNKPNETVECIEKILKLQTDDLINLYDLAEYLNSNGILYAKKLYEKIISIEKSDYSIEEIYVKAVCAIILNDTETEKYFYFAFKHDIKDISNIFWLNAIARRLLELKQYKLANICFQKVLNLNDTSNYKDKNILIKKAIASKVLGKKQDAIDYFNKILELNVTDISFLYKAGLQSSGLDSKTAQKFFKKISQLKMLNPNYLFINGMSEYFLHHTKEAIDYLKQIEVQNLEDTNILLKIGLVMSNLNEDEFAKNCFNKVIKITTKFEFTPISEFDYINPGIAYKYLMDLNPQNEELKEAAEKNYWEAVTKYEESIFQFNMSSPFLYDFFNEKDGSDNDEEKNKLYHYTSIAGLKGILDNKELWVTKSNFLNDPKETRYSFEVFEKLNLNDIIPDIKGDFLNELKFIKDSKKEVGEEKEEVEGEKKDVYILSMSADGDSLPMWKNYSNDDGYNIKVDKNKLKSSFMNPGTYISGKVIYIDTEEKDNEEQYKPIKNLLSSIYKSGKAYKKENDKLTDEIIKKTVFAHIRLISLFLKHTGFEYEHEYRYVFIPEFWLNNKTYEIRNDDQEKTYNYNGIVNYYPNFRTNGKVIIPYITIPIYGLIDPHEPVIEEIRFSPTLDKIVAKQGLDDYLKLQGLAKIDVKPSSVQFRNI